MQRPEATSFSIRNSNPCLKEADKETDKEADKEADKEFDEDGNEIEQKVEAIPVRSQMAGGFSIAVMNEHTEDFL